MQIAPAPRSMPRSGIREIGEIAAATPGVIRLEIGEPDADTPAHIIEAADRAARAGRTHYSPNAGIAGLREALAEKMHAVNGVTADPGRIVVTNGAVNAIFNTLAAIITAGDEVLVPDPGWPNYRMMIALLGGRSIPFAVPAEGTPLDLDALSARTSSRTKAIIVNSPSNPTGGLIDSSALRDLYVFAERHDLWIIADDVYDQIVFDSAPYSVGSVEDAPARVITVGSFSKTYAMTGWRVGYLAAPPSLAEVIAKIQEPVVSCVNTPAQFGALAALEGPQDFVRTSVATYRHRASIATGLLRGAGVAYLPPRGGFYLWVSTGDAPGADVARALVRDHGVAVAPGATFGDSGRHAVRIALANTDDRIREGIDRILASGLITGRTDA
ncbi:MULTISPECIES: pyridoxal phosphate-dependent aminotransferase [unclassified Microbacterium]|uniref:pyridoxal phosphate-dependent aminotransferase n=1 Tax=unclassified Microbacterium TaxID=2609290 RepID=UPI0030161B15